MRVLHLIYSVDPIQGGTVEALLQIIKASKDTSQTHEILTLDDPACLESFGYDQTIHAVGPTKRFYGNTPKLDDWLEQHIMSYDCAVIHGCWQYHGLATFRKCSKYGIPYVQYTHGMLDPWFKRTYPLKHLKKWLYWPWAEYRILRHAQRVIFTCEEEERLAARSFWLYKVNPTVIPLGIQEPAVDFETCSSAFYRSFPQLQGKRLLTFMSRIHLKKGVDLLIEAAIQAQSILHNKSGTLDESITLVIAGPCNQPEFLNELKQRSKELPKDGPFESIEWLPMVQGASKWALLNESEAFILPSHQENFGMVVPESLFCGTPVLISNKVNIWREVQEDQAALVEEDTLSGTITLIQQWLELSPGQRQEKRQFARLCFEKRFLINKNAEALFEMLNQITKTKA